MDSNRSIHLSAFSACFFRRHSLCYVSYDLHPAGFRSFIASSEARSAAAVARGLRSATVVGALRGPLVPQAGRKKGFGENQNMQMQDKDFEKIQIAGQCKIQEISKYQNIKA